MFEKIIARYVYIDTKTEFQSRIKCSVSTVSGEFMIEVTEAKGFKLFPVKHYAFNTREEANAKFVELSKKYKYVKS